MPANGTLLDQYHNAIDRELFSMKGFYHSGGRQAVFLTGSAYLKPDSLPTAGQECGLVWVEVEGGRRSTSDRMLNLQILTSGGLSVHA
jgi:hypothetical protein